MEYDGWVLYALDHTPCPRRAAKTVSDLGLVHGADGVKVGHQYSLLGRVMYEKRSWVGVVDVERIATHQTPTKVAATQINRLKINAILKRIIAMDSEYVTGTQTGRVQRDYPAFFLTLERPIVLQNPVEPLLGVPRLSPDSQTPVLGPSQASTGLFSFSLRLFFAADLTL